MSMRQLLSRKSNQNIVEQTPRHAKHEPLSKPNDSSKLRMFPPPPIIRRSEGKKLNEPMPEATNRPTTAGNASQTSDVESTSTLRDESDRKVTQRSQYLASDSGPPEVLTVTKTSNEELVTRRCEDEPIRAPGSIQRYGALLGLKYGEHKHLQVRIASENCRKVLGYGPEQLFELPSFLDVLRVETRQEMIAHINHLLRTGDHMEEETQLDVFRIVIAFPFEPEIMLWCAMHVAPGGDGLVICELEEYSDAFYFKEIDSAKTLPVTSPPPMGVDVSADEFKKSTTSVSQPLPVLAVARKGGSEHFSSMDIFKAMTQAQKQIAACTSLPKLFDVVVGVVAELTCFHRVMFYRFDTAMNGCVESELVNPQASTDVFRGMHFPASDIPKQAQELYKINRIRLLHDRGAETAQLVYRTKSDTEQPLDLTHSYLRAISPVHCKYLANMGVRSTMSISIVINDKLWGLIACHGYGDTGSRVSPPIRELCRSIGECAAANIQKLLMRQRIEARTIPLTNIAALNSANFISNSSGDLLTMVDADSAVLSIDGKTRAIGMLDPYQEALTILSYLQSCRFTTIQSSHNIQADFPGLVYAPGFNVIGGLLLIPLNVREGNHFLVFFREIKIRQVNWAGNPFAKVSSEGSHYLEPRTSFKRWGETIAGMSNEWTEDQLEAALVLSTVYSRLIEMWRDKNTASEAARIALIRESTHEFGPALHALIDSLELASENIVDERVRDVLSTAQEASDSLINTVDHLLKLTDVEDGTSHDTGETFNLKLTATRVLQVLQREAQRNASDLTMTIHDRLPTYVKGNGDRFKQLLVYFAKAGLRRSSSVKFDVFLVRAQKESSKILVQVQDSGQALSESEIDITIAEFESGQKKKKWAVPVMDTTPSIGETDGVLSVGVTAISEYIRSLDGIIQITSDPGTGTIFSLELSFEHSPLSKPRTHDGFATTPQPPMRQSASPSPPLKSPKPMAKVSRRRGDQAINQMQSSWDPSPRSSSLSSPPDKALPVRPGQHNHVPNGSYPRGVSPGVLGQRDHALHVSARETLPGRSHRHEHALTVPRPREVSHQTSHENMYKEGNRHDHSNLNILIADNDTFGLRILNERLSQWGHSVQSASDGLQCHDRFALNPADVVLIELNMPGVDGTYSTRMIRFSEKEQAQANRDSSGSDLRESQNGKIKQRAAVFVVSASLREDDRFDYLQSGFDGWILKPIDFRRLELILQGLKDPKIRKDTVYSPGEWEKGGWFLP